MRQKVHLNVYMKVMKVEREWIACFVLTCVSETFLVPEAGKWPTASWHRSNWSRLPWLDYYLYMYRWMDRRLTLSSSISNWNLIIICMRSTCLCRASHWDLRVMWCACPPIWRYIWGWATVRKRRQRSTSETSALYASFLFFSSVCFQCECHIKVFERWDESSRHFLTHPATVSFLCTFILPS